MKREFGITMLVLSVLGTVLYLLYRQSKKVMDTEGYCFDSDFDSSILSHDDEESEGIIRCGDVFYAEGDIVINHNKRNNNGFPSCRSFTRDINFDDDNNTEISDNEAEDDIFAYETDE